MLQQPRAWRICALAAAVGIPACGGAPEGQGPGAPAGAGRVELGAGLVEFVPLPPEGGEIEIVSGPQGGFHVQVTARLFDLDPDGVTLVYEARDRASGAALNLPARYAISEERVIDGGDHHVRVGDRLVLDVGSAGEVAGVGVELSLSAERGGAALATDARAATLVDAVDELR